MLKSVWAPTLRGAIGGMVAVEEHEAVDLGHQLYLQTVWESFKGQIMVRRPGPDPAILYLLRAC